MRSLAHVRKLLAFVASLGAGAACACTPKSGDATFSQPEGGPNEGRDQVSRREPPASGDIGEASVEVSTVETPDGSIVRIPGEGAVATFGSSVAVSGQKILAAAAFEDQVVEGETHERVGAVYVLDQIAPHRYTKRRLQEGPMTPRAGECNASHLTSPPVVHDDVYAGTMVVADGDGAIVGRGGAMDRVGAVYVYPTTAPGQLPSIVPEPGGGREYDCFGASLSASEEYLFVGAPGYDTDPDDPAALNVGAVFVFERKGDSFEFVQRLPPPDPRPNAMFGYSVSASGDALIVGAPGNDGHGDGGLVFGSGAAFIYKRIADSWNLDEALQVQRTLAATPDVLGFSAAIDGDSYAVGAPTGEPCRSSAPPSISGVAYLGSLLPNHAPKCVDAGASSPPFSFGASVALHGGRAAVGSPADYAILSTGEKGSDLFGAVYLFDDALPLPKRVVAPSVGSADAYGTSVALSDELLVVGAPHLVVPTAVNNFGHSVFGQGAVYVHTL